MRLSNLHLTYLSVLSARLCKVNVVVRVLGVSLIFRVKPEVTRTTSLLSMKEKNRLGSSYTNSDNEAVSLSVRKGNLVIRGVRIMRPWCLRSVDPSVS